MTEDTLKMLQKMTRTKLIEEAKKYPEIAGAHGMNKAQLIEVISESKKAAGEWIEAEVKEKEKVEEKKEEASSLKGTMKKQIKEFKKQRNEALASGDKKALVKARAGITKLKGRLRRMKMAG